MGRNRLVAGNTKVAIAYLRASTDAQTLSPEAQRASIEAWAKREGVQVDVWCVDQGVSGATAIQGRAGLLRALAALRAHGAGVLVVAKRDRLGRDAVECGLIEREVKKAGAVVVSAAGEGSGNKPADKMMRTVLDAFSEYDLEMIRARTKAALAAKSAKGERVGTVPFGYRVADDGVHLVADDGEQATLARVRELASKRLGSTAIARALAVEGIVGRTGRALSQPQVWHLLQVMHRIPLAEAAEACGIELAG